MNTIKFSQLSTLPQNDKDNSYFLNDSLVIGITDKTAMVTTIDIENDVFTSNPTDSIELNDNTELTVTPKVNQIPIESLQSGDVIFLFGEKKTVVSIETCENDYDKNYIVHLNGENSLDVKLMTQFYVFKETPQETKISNDDVIDEPIDYSQKQIITIEQAYEVQQSNPEIVITDSDNSKITITKDDEYDCYEYVNEEGITTICDENELVTASYRELYEMIANKIKNKLPKQTYKLEETANRIATHHYLFTQRLDRVS